MKKKTVIILVLFLLMLLLTSCDEALSVVTVGDNGEKVVNNYVSMFGKKVYDATATFRSWQDVNIVGFDDEKVKVADSISEMGTLLFKIENSKEKIVVFGDKDAAIEIKFFDGGYQYTIFISMDEFDKSMNEFNKSMNEFDTIFDE